MLKCEVVEVSGQKYEVKELTIGQLIGILPRLTGDDSANAQLDMLKMSVHKDGEPMGDAVSDLGVSHYMPLLNASMTVNGLGNEE